MKAELISVGSSLLTGVSVNDNAAFLARELSAMGVSLTQAVMIHDDSEKLKAAVKTAEAEAELIILTGGLGPDDNDIVKTAMSDYLNKPLVLDEAT